MKTRLCEIDAAAGPKLPEFTGDKSGIGVHYVDACLKSMNRKLEDGTPVRAKRRGLKVMLTVGTRKGEGLLRRLEFGPNPVVMLNAALAEAGKAAGVELSVEGAEIFLEL